MTKQKLLNLTNDYIFKRTFGYSGDEEVTRIFLRDILQTEITKIELNNNPITEKDLLDDKVGIMDLKAVLNDSVKCDVEMQVTKQDDIEKRIMYYWSKAYVHGFKQGQDYDSLNKTIAILIADFELDNLKTIPKYITKWNIREEEYPAVILTPVLEVIIIELPKIEKYGKFQNRVNMNLWVKFIRNPEVFDMSEELKKIKKEDMNENVNETVKAIEQAKEKLEELSEDEHARELAELRAKYMSDQKSIQKYGYRVGREAGFKDGFKDGSEKGAQQKIIETVKNMVRENMSDELIMKIANISIDELNKIKDGE